MFVPSNVGEEAGLKVAMVSVNKYGKFKLPVRNPSVQRSVKLILVVQLEPLVKLKYCPWISFRPKCLKKKKSTNIS